VRKPPGGLARASVRFVLVVLVLLGIVAMHGIGSGPATAAAPMAGHVSMAATPPGPPLAMGLVAPAGAAGQPQAPQPTMPAGHHGAGGAVCLAVLALGIALLPLLVPFGRRDRGSVRARLPLPSADRTLLAAVPWRRPPAVLLLRVSRT